MMTKCIQWVGLSVMTVLMTFAADTVPLSQQQTRTSPEWLTRRVMYQIWLRGFTPEGTLRAAT